MDKTKYENYICTFRNTFLEEIFLRCMSFKSAIVCKIYPAEKEGFVFDFCLTNGIVRDEVFESKKNLKTIIKEYFPEVIEQFSIDKVFSSNSMCFIDNRVVLVKINDSALCDLNVIKEDVKLLVKEILKFIRREEERILEKENIKLKEEILKLEKKVKNNEKKILVEKENHKQPSNSTIRERLISFLKFGGKCFK